MRILVCGGRDYTDKRKVFDTLNGLDAVGCLVHGGATGADQLAARWAQVMGIEVRVYVADWETHGKAAGPIRNQQMIDEEKPDLVVAFAGNAGTADCVRRARKAGIEVMEVA